MSLTDAPTPRAPGRIAEGALARIRALLPEGRLLQEAVWLRRHRTMMFVLGAHVPAIFVFAALTHGPLHGLVEAGPVAALLLAALRGKGRDLRSISATIGLLTCSAILVHLSGGLIEFHFHFFAMLGLIALYQDWKPFLAAIGYVLLHHGVVGALAPHEVYNHPSALAKPWHWAMIHAGFVLAASLATLTFWRLTEEAHEAAESSFKLLIEERDRTFDAMRETQNLKDELVAVVSHEFRTPLTGIIGYAKTLARAGDGIGAMQREDFIDRIGRQANRLNRLVDNLLVASRLTETDDAASASFSGVLAGVLEEIEGMPGGKDSPFVVGDAPEGLRVRMTPDAFHRVLANLLSNAIKFGTPGAPVNVFAFPTDDEVLVGVTNAGSSIPPADRERVFEPFVQLDSSSTRSAAGVGLGLNIVRRLVETYGGAVDVTSGPDWTTFTVRLGRVAAGEGTTEEDLSFARSSGSIQT